MTFRTPGGNASTTSSNKAAARNDGGGRRPGRLLGLRLGFNDPKARQLRLRRLFPEALSQPSDSFRRTEAQTNVTFRHLRLTWIEADECAAKPTGHPLRGEPHRRNGAPCPKLDHGQPGTCVG